MGDWGSVVGKQEQVENTKGLARRLARGGVDLSWGKDEAGQRTEGPRGQRKGRRRTLSLRVEMYCE